MLSARVPRRKYGEKKMKPDAVTNAVGQKLAPNPPAVHPSLKSCPI
jgi:hypothetical protein